MCHAFAPVMSIMAFSAVSASGFPQRKQRLKCLRETLADMRGEREGGVMEGGSTFKQCRASHVKDKKEHQCCPTEEQVDALTWDLNSGRSREGVGVGGASVQRLLQQSVEISIC